MSEEIESPVLEAYEIVNKMIELTKRLADVNDRITDENQKVDVIVLLNQHRHKNNDQDDHTECIALQFISGSYEGNAGALMLLGLEHPYGRKMIYEAYSVLTIMGIRQVFNKSLK